MMCGSIKGQSERTLDSLKWMHSATDINADKSCGKYSFAVGASGATGENSIAMGWGNSATARDAVSLGRLNISSGIESIAIGKSNTASGLTSLAIGTNATATGIRSISMGEESDALGIESFAVYGDAIGGSSVAIGHEAEAKGNNSFAIGNGNEGSGFTSMALGHATTAYSAYETVVGRYNEIQSPLDSLGWNPFDRLFVVGNGGNSLNRSNALEIRKNGEVSFQHYTFPNADGTASQVMKTDGSGQLTWSSDADEQTLTRTTDSIVISNGNTVSIVPDMLQDADGNTGIKAEQSANEDQLRFRTGGTERMVIDDAGVTHINDVMHLTPRGVAPSSPAEGTVYYDSTTKKVTVWTGLAWEDLN